MEGYRHDKRCHQGSSSLCIMRVEYGEAVPFSGILQTVELAAMNMASFEAQIERLELQLETQKEDYELQLELKDKEYEIDREAWEKKEEAYKKTLKRVGPKWYKSPVFVATTTAVVIIGGAIAIGYATR